MHKNRWILGYLVLVGVPLALLVGTLRAGRTLIAPPAISGDWAMTFSNAERDLPQSLTVHQEGSSLLISTRGAEHLDLDATLTDGNIAGRAAHAPHSGAPAISQMEAHVYGRARERFIAGRIWFDNCASCAPMQFRATRIAAPAR